MSRIIIYDTTLRDGSQTEGVSYTVNDKIKITHKLDELGVHYIEGGWPGCFLWAWEHWQAYLRPNLELQ